MGIVGDLLNEFGAAFVILRTGGTTNGLLRKLKIQGEGQESVSSLLLSGAGDLTLQAGETFTQVSTNQKHLMVSLDQKAELGEVDRQRCTVYLCNASVSLQRKNEGAPDQFASISEGWAQVVAATSCYVRLQNLEDQFRVEGQTLKASLFIVMSKQVASVPQVGDKALIGSVEYQVNAVDSFAFGDHCYLLECSIR